MFKRLPKPNGFQYIPQYYDPLKEDLKERLKKYDETAEMDDVETVKSRIRGGFRSRYKSFDGTSPTEFRRNHTRQTGIIRLVIFMALLVVIIFVAGAYIEEILMMME